MPAPKRPRTRSDRPPLTREAILASALRLVDREGLEALSMRRLGSEMGVEAMSLYNHVPNKAAVLDGLHELILGEVDSPPRGPDCWDWLGEVARRLRRALLAHPHALPIFATRPAVAPGSMRRMEEAFAVLLEAGLAPLQTLYAFQSLMVFVIGHALAEAGSPVGEEPGPAPEAAYQALPAAEFPALGRVLAAYSAFDFDAEFEFGLEALLEGLRQKA